MTEIKRNIDKLLSQVEGVEVRLPFIEALRNVRVCQKLPLKFVCISGFQRGQFAI